MHYHRLFSDKSDLYERSRPTYPKALYEYVADLCPLTHLAWDSACGNGQASIGLVEEFDRVFASDVSDEQISNAKQHPRVNYAVSTSEKTPLDDQSCDLICVAQALHWFDYDQFWPEAKRVLKPNGIFMALGYNWPSVNNQIDDAISNTIMSVIEPYWAPQNQLIWNYYRDINIPFKRIETPVFEMKVKWNLNEYFNFLHSFSATRRCMDAIGADFFDTAYECIAELWGEPTQVKVIDLDFVLYVGRNETEGNKVS